MKAKEEREAAEAKAAQERATREKVEKELADKNAAEEKAGEARLAAEKKAAAAPRQDKLKAYAKEVCRLALPLMAEFSPAEQKELSEGVARFAKWLETKADSLGGELL